MTIENVSALIAGIAGNDETRRLILAQALDRSAIDMLHPAVRLTSPVVRGAFAGEVEAYAVSEGGQKTLTSGAMTTVSYSVKPVAIVVPVSNLFVQSESDMMKALTDQLIAGLARGIDRTILRDTELVFGASVTGSASTASNTTSAASATAITYAEMSTLFGVVETDGYSVNGVIVREGNKAALRTAETTGGNRFWVPASQDTPDNIFGQPTAFVKSNGSLPVLPQTGAAAEVMAVAGDWNQLHWGIYGDFQIDVNPYAQDYYMRNMSLVRAEVYIGFAILNNSAFATLLEP